MITFSVVSCEMYPYPVRQIERLYQTSVTMEYFLIDKYEVTNKNYNNCVKTGKCTSPHYNDGKCWHKYSKIPIPDEFKEDNKPVVCVDFEQAKQYCNWLGKQLPTEIEWEYAAKGSEQNYYTGSDIVGDVAWYSGNSNSVTHDVGTKKKNKFGIYDMTGNVWEFTTSPCMDDNCYFIRGGSWIDSDEFILLSARSKSYKEADSSVGFRCIKY